MSTKTIYTVKKLCKHCGEHHDIRGNQCRVCKNGLYRYNMTRLDMIKLHEEQDKKCALCDKDVEMFNGSVGGMVDHNHTTGKVRSILCGECNTFVGSIENHKDIEKVLEYIKVI